MADVKVKGLRELQRFLEQLPPKLEANVMRGALRAGANLVAADAKARVPVKTGRLRESIRVSTRRSNGTVFASVKVGDRRARKKVSQRNGGGVRVQYENPFYAHFVEFGTQAHRIGVKYAKALVLRPNARATAGVAGRWVRAGMLAKGVSHPGARPKPFLRPAVAAKSDEAIRTVANTIKRRLQRKHGLDASGVEVGIE